MKPQFCYVVTGGVQSEYANMAAVSASFLRYLYPEGRIVLVCDTETLECIRASSHALTILANELVGVPVALPTAVQRSRYLKTSLRRIVDGPFIFLDADTLPIRRFDALLAVRAPFGAVPDWNSLPERRLPPRIPAIFERMGWSLPSEEKSWYFNSGVFWLGDSPESHRLAERWHGKWCEHMQRESHEDQPALHSAIHDTQTRVQVMSSTYNAMLMYNAPTVARARILHFFSSAAPLDGMVFRSLMDEVAREGNNTGSHVSGAIPTRKVGIRQQRIAEVLSRRYPWKDQTSVHNQWYTGHYLTAARVGIAKLTSRLVTRVRHSLRSRNASR